jgi:hypothetical protein
MRQRSVDAPDTPSGSLGVPRRLAHVSYAPSRRNRAGTTALALAAAVSLTATTVISLAGPASAAASSATQVFTYKGHPETYIVPPGVETLDIVASGGRGGHSHADAAGGPGIQVNAHDIPVKPGQKFLVGVGGNGGSAAGGGKIPNFGEGGYNNGASGARGGGGGGGFSYVQASNGHHIVVAGGGGGGSGGVGGPQNPPGTLDGQNGGGSLGTPQGGGGGTLTGGGRGGHNSSPFVGDGKGGGRYSGGSGGVGLLPHGSSGGAGGGGGYFGGGGGAGSEAGGGGGGGAGSSFVEPNVQTIVTPHAGSGEVKITGDRVREFVMQCATLEAQVGQTLTNLHIATSDGKPLPTVTVFLDPRYNRFPPGLTYQRWPEATDTWLVLNGRLTEAARFQWVFDARLGDRALSCLATLDVKGPSSETTPTSTSTTSEAPPTTTPPTTTPPTTTTPETG